MKLPPDDLAGIVDIVGPVTRDELVAACGELAFKRGEDGDAAAFDEQVEAALSSYHLVSVADHATDADAALVVVGPAAFPELPEGAEDLPHILDLPPRNVSREAAAEAAETRFRADAADAVRQGDEERIRTLLDVSYDLESWGPVDLSRARSLLDEATHAN